MSHNEYEETIAATRIGTCVERFTPQFEVVSVNLALSADGQSEILSLQRGFGVEAEEEEGICLVLSPSQQCSYKPFEELTLTRNSLGMKFTAEAQRIFNVSSALFAFQASDAVFEDVKEKLKVMSKGEPYFVCAENAA